MDVEVARWNECGSASNGSGSKPFLDLERPPPPAHVQTATLNDSRSSSISRPLRLGQAFGLAKEAKRVCDAEPVSPERRRGEVAYG